MGELQGVHTEQPGNRAGGCASNGAYYSLIR